MLGELDAYGNEIDYSVDYSPLEDTYNYDDYSYDFWADDSVIGGEGLNTLQEEDYSNVIGTDTSFGQGIINLTSEMGSGVLGDTAFGQQVIEASHVGNTSPIFDGVLKVAAPVFTTAIGTAVNRWVGNLFGNTSNVANRPVAPTGYHYDTAGRLINNTTGQPLVGSAVASSGLSMQNILMYGVAAFAGYKVLKATKVL